MPIYEYKCRACDLSFEVKRGFSESPGADCPNCRCQAQRIFSPVPIVFKGPGFYCTDNATAGKSGYASSKGDGEKPTGEASASEAAENKTVETTSESETAKPKPAEVKS